MNEDFESGIDKNQNTCIVPVLILVWTSVQLKITSGISSFSQTTNFYGDRWRSDENGL